MATQCRMLTENQRQCGKYVWKCKKCGSAGCDNTACKKQNFNGTNGMCLTCSETNARVSL